MISTFHPVAERTHSRNAWELRASRKALVPTGIACIRAFLDPAVPGCRDTVGPQWPARLAAIAIVIDDEDNRPVGGVVEPQHELVAFDAAGRQPVARTRARGHADLERAVGAADHFLARKAVALQRVVTLQAQHHVDEQLRHDDDDENEEANQNPLRLERQLKLFGKEAPC